MRLFAIERLDKYSRERQIYGNKTWELYRTIADEAAARLVGTMMIKLEAEAGHAGAIQFLKQKEGGTDGQTQKGKTE